MKTTPSHLSRIDDLTRRYARYSRHQAGLSAVWAGVCLALLGSLLLTYDLVRYSNRASSDQALGFWRFLTATPSQDQPILILLTAVALPALWLFGRGWIQRRVYERNGTVIGQETSSETNTRQTFNVIEIVTPCLLIPLQWIGAAMKGFSGDFLPGTLLANVLMLALPLAGRRMASGLDRGASMLLFMGCAIVVAGGAGESLLVCMLAYAILGICLAGQGLRSHWEFRRVRRELDCPSVATPVNDDEVSSSKQSTGSLLQ